jgi:hypothetical protein
MPPHEAKMSTACLRGLLIFQWLAVALAIHFGQMSLDWQRAPDVLFKGSPDAFHTMSVVVSTWWMMKGACIGIAVNMILLAVWRRADIAAGNWLVKLHWLGFVLPVPLLLWFGRHITP